MIPESHKDLLENPVVVSLVTLMPDNQPQATPVWIDYDGTHVLVNTATGRQKDANMRERPQVAVLAIDPANPYRWLEVRGKVVAETTEGAVAHIDRLAKQYFGREKYYTDPALAERETRVIFKIEPTHVNAGG